jgi:hypothetical protein
MKNKHCSWCDHQFEQKVSYQIYCSAECREAATKEKIAARYLATKIKNRYGKKRLCKSCQTPLSIYNDENVCQSCYVDPLDLAKILKEIKGLANGKPKKSDE